MKKIFSIAFVAILLLNVMGYYGVFLGLEYRNDLAMTRVLDGDQYSDSQTVTIKIPLSVAYMADQNEFQRVDGKFEHNGEHYRLVKQKYAHDTLTVICVRDIENKRISQQLSKYVQNFSDNAADEDESSKVIVNMIKDYLPQTFAVRAHSSGWQVEIAHHSFYNDLVPTFEVSVIHPPERVNS